MYRKGADDEQLSTSSGTVPDGVRAEADVLLSEPPDLDVRVTPAAPAVEVQVAAANRSCRTPQPSRYRSCEHPGIPALGSRNRRCA